MLDIYGISIGHNVAVSITTIDFHGESSACVATSPTCLHLDVIATGQGSGGICNKYPRLEALSWYVHS